MRVSIPGLSGVYYDTDAESTAVTTALTLAGRRAPKPQGYAVQVLPHLWSFDVDLREVPADHPLQYLHPEGARSIEALPRERSRAADVGRSLDAAVRFAWAINAETETAIERLTGRRDAEDVPPSAIESGGTAVDDLPGFDDSTTDEGSQTSGTEPITIEIEDRDAAGDEADDGSDRSGDEPSSETDRSGDETNDEFDPIDDVDPAAGPDADDAAFDDEFEE